MDRITSSLLKEFSTQYGYADLAESIQFEHFVNLAIVSGEYQDSFEPSAVHVGGQNNPGIDGLAVIVNGALVEDEQEVDDLLVTNKHLDVRFIFTQAKTSSSFDGGDIGTFIEAVRDFFRAKPLLMRGNDLQRKAEIADHIFTYTSKMKTNPTLSLFYVTTGTWTNDKNLSARLHQGKHDLELSSLFSSVRVDALGAKELQRLYRAGREALAVEIEFPNKVTLPEIPGVAQSFIGTLPVATLFELIVGENKELRHSVFEENIRAFQGDTTVNNGISQTLAQAASTFVVLNNGVTIVCREITQVGAKCTLRGYQIVNGCQTSNVLFTNRDKYEPSNVLVPVKLIATEDDEIINSVILATNSQNAVKPEELEAMTDFQKELEAYYRTYTGTGALYYERRSKQWVATQVEKTRVVTIPNQIRALASMFLDVPHRVSGYYGTVRGRLGNGIFRKGHILKPYYTSALALYRLDALFRAKALETQHKRLRWFLLMLFRQYVAGPALSLDDKKSDKYCDVLIDTLLSYEESAKRFNEILDRLSEAKKLSEVNGDSVKTQNLRDSLLAVIPKGA